MRYCETCRLKKKLPRNNGFPFVGLIQSGECDFCRTRHIQVHDVELKKTDTTNEKVVDKVKQDVYRMKCAELAIYFASGPRKGTLNVGATEELKQIEIRVNGEIDWVSTFELRVRARDSYTEVESKQRR